MMTRKLILLSSTFAIAISACFVSCKKDTAQNNANTYDVEYGIVPANNNFTRITYNDPAGTPIVLNDITQFQNGIKNITVSTKPFTAKISTEINNQSTSPIYFDLYISVSGQRKIVVACSSPPMAIAVGVAEYTVQ